MQKTNLNKWIQDSIKSSVYISGPNDFTKLPPSYPLSVKEEELPVLNPPIVKVETDNSVSVADQILEILTNRNIRRGSKSLLESYLPEINKKIERMVLNNQPISFVLPTLPFKDQSPLTTGLSIDAVDLGEYAFFSQLRRILGSISNIYKPGAHFTLLCDGYIYADIFANGDVDGAGRYKASCEKIKNKYGLYNEVTLFDMREVVFDMPEWNKEKNNIEKAVREMYLNEGSVRHRVEALSDQMIFHTSLPYSYDELINLLKLKNKSSDIQKNLDEAAIKYISIALTVKYTGIISHAFPSAIRCTVHPKHAPQIPLNLTNRNNLLLPYNGVATISRQKIKNNESFFEALRTQRLVTIYSLEDVVSVHNSKNKEFMYYEIP